MNEAEEALKVSVEQKEIIQAANTKLEEISRETQAKHDDETVELKVKLETANSSLANKTKESDDAGKFYEDELLKLKEELKDEKTQHGKIKAENEKLGKLALEKAEEFRLAMALQKEE